MKMDLQYILMHWRESIEKAIKTSSTIRITINIVSMLVEKFMGFNILCMSLDGKWRENIGLDR